MNQKNIIIFVQTVIFAATTIYLNFWVKQNQFYELAISYTVLFLIYVIILRQMENKQYSNNFFLYYWLVVGILLRGVLCWHLPNLSDDIYRFVWDGRLAINGFNPFDYTPSQFMEKNFVIKGLDNELYKNLNSQDYFTIYPTICQIIFGLAAKWSATTQEAIFIIKLILLCFEIGVIILLLNFKKIFNTKKIDYKFSYTKKIAVWYALNPLAIIEIVGNTHFEGVMLFFLFLAFYGWEKNKIWLTALFLACAVATKLLPLLFLPLWWRYLNHSKKWLFYGFFSIVILLLFLPLFNSVFFEHFLSSFQLYFTKFEFNASIYFLIKEILVFSLGYYPNIIVALIYVSLIVSFILYLTYSKTATNLFTIYEKMLLSISIYLFFSGIVHAWYVLLPLGLGLLSRFRFAWLWSFTVFFSYSFYLYNQNLFWVILLSYLPIYALIFYEIKTLKYN